MYYLSADRSFLLPIEMTVPNREANDTRRCRTMAVGARVKITLRCNECKQRNYNTMKNKKNTPDRIEMKKYCRFCRKHTVHSETK
jgi:large subunit ribosomal protein L33